MGNKIPSSISQTCGMPDFLEEQSLLPARTACTGWSGDSIIKLTAASSAVCWYMSCCRRCTQPDANYQLRSSDARRCVRARGSRTRGTSSRHHDGVFLCVEPSWFRRDSRRHRAAAVTDAPQYLPCYYRGHERRIGSYHSGFCGSTAGTQVRPTASFRGTVKESLTNSLTKANKGL